MELLCNDISIKFLIILALSMKALQCIEKNNIGIEVTIVTSIFEYDIIVYQYIHQVSNNFSSRCEVSDIYREK
jgi:hypothetical protein